MLVLAFTSTSFHAALLVEAFADDRGILWAALAHGVKCGFVVVFELLYFFRCGVISLPPGL
jgi:hypothetical protein